MSTQHFFRDGKWVSRAQLQAMKEANHASKKLEEIKENPKEHDAIKTPQNIMGGMVEVLDGLEIEDLRDHYESVFAKPVPNAYKNKADWIKTKIIEYVKE